MAVEAAAHDVEAAADKPVDVAAAPPLAAAVNKNGSFREESNRPADLREPERRALADLRDRLEAAILDGTLLTAADKPVAAESVEKDAAPAAAAAAAEEVPVAKPAAASRDLSIWGLILKKVAPKAEEKPQEEKEAATEAAIEAEEEAAIEAEDKKEAEEEAAIEAEAEAPAEASPEKAVEEAEAEAEKKDEATPETAATPAVDKDISLWGVPLLPSKADERTDTILLKFLRARDFKVAAALAMIGSTLRWRKDSGVDAILGEEDPFAGDLDAACFIDGADREGHPVCYNVFGVLADEELYKKVFGADKERFVRWRVRAMEAGVKRLELSPGGAASLLQITDLKASPGPARKELKAAMKEVVELLQDNYPEMVARNIFINVPFWYYAFSTIFNPFLTQRTRSKFVFARPSRVTETLLKYIPADAIPVKYGGLKREGDTEFAEDGDVSEIILKANATETIEIPVVEGGIAVTWDLAVVGWEVNYKEEFVPADEGSYTVIIRKARKMEGGEEAVRNTFRAGEAGKVVLTVENATFKKKKILFRHKAITSKAC